MTSIPVAACRILCYNFKRQYLQKPKISINFLLHLWNLHQICNIGEKKDESPSLSIFKIIDSERVGT